MKTSQSQKQNLQALFLSLGILSLTLFNVQTSLSNTKWNAKKVIYKGEWITRVSLPEVNIVADRIKKGGPSPYLKTIETVSENGEQLIHVTMNEINITANSGILINVENNLSEQEDAESLTSQESIADVMIFSQQDIEPIEQKKNPAFENDYHQNSARTTELAKKPLFNRITNSVVKAGLKFLQKVNDGLFFKS